MVRRRSPLLLLAALIAVVLGALWQRFESPASRSDAPVAAAPTGAPAVERPATPPSATRETPPASDRLASVVRSEAERERLVATLALIESDGPFPYDKDGSVFGNREGRLPKKPRGYYREYTVPTDGASNRGARRIVQGREGETYYTRDHYRTFVRLDR